MSVSCSSSNMQSSHILLTFLFYINTLNIFKILFKSLPIPSCSNLWWLPSTLYFSSDTTCWFPLCWIATFTARGCPYVLLLSPPWRAPALHPTSNNNTYPGCSHLAVCSGPLISHFVPLKLPSIPATSVDFYLAQPHLMNLEVNFSGREEQKKHKKSCVTFLNKDPWGTFLWWKI